MYFAKFLGGIWRSTVLKLPKLANMSIYKMATLKRLEEREKQ